MGFGWERFSVEFTWSESGTVTQESREFLEVVLPGFISWRSCVKSKAHWVEDLALGLWQWQDRW